MKNFLTLLIAISCLVTSCLDLPDAPEGMGSFVLNIGNTEAERTILPVGEPDFQSYKLTFTPATGSPAANIEFSVLRDSLNVSTEPVYLNEGIWNLAVNAYTSPTEDPQALVAEGVLDAIEISSGQTTTSNVVLKAILGGEGTFKWDIAFDISSYTLDPASVMTISQVDGTVAEQINLATDRSGTRTLDSGYYRVFFNLIIEDSDGKRMATRREVLHVYQNMESEFTHTFTTANFFGTLGGTVVITGEVLVGEVLTVDTSDLGGTGTIYYQWKRLGGNIPGATSSSYTVQSDDLGVGISVEVYRAGWNGSITSPEVAVGVQTPSITTQPQDGTYIYGQTISALTVAASISDGGTLSYQWQIFNDINNEWEVPVETSTLESFTPTNLETGAYRYRVTVTNTNGVGTVSIISQEAVITVTPQPITDAAITVTAPVKDATPSTTATGTGNFTVSAVTWSSTTGVISGNFLADTVYIVSVTLTANANYTFSTDFTATINGNDADTNLGVNANSVTVSHTFDPTLAAEISITTQPVVVTTVMAGNIYITLTVDATVDGGATLSYQWYSNTTDNNTGGILITGATTANFDIPTTLTAGTYYYYCIVSANLGAAPVTSNIAVVTVQQEAAFTITFTQIADAAPNITGPTIYKNPGELHAITLENSTQYNSIEWYIDGVELPGSANSEAITLNPANYGVGQHSLTVEVLRAGVPYNKTVIFTVEP